MPTIGPRRCGIRATASYCRTAQVCTDPAACRQLLLIGFAHDNMALRGCSPSCWAPSELSPV